MCFPCSGFQFRCLVADDEQPVRDASKQDQLNHGFLARPFKAISAKISIRWVVVVFCLIVWLTVLLFFLF